MSDQVQLLAALTVFLITSQSGAIAGSMAAIRPAWHKEPIYSRCIRPRSGMVYLIPGFVVAIAWLGAYLAASKEILARLGRSDLLTRSLIFIAFWILLYFVAKTVAWFLGTFIYGNSVRREGLGGPPSTSGRL